MSNGNVDRGRTKLGRKISQVSSPLFSIVTVNYNNARLLLEVLTRTIEALKGFPYEIIVVDNNSTDGSYEFLSQTLKAYRWVSVLNSGRNGGFGFGCNFGAKNSKSPILWFLNSDAWICDTTKLADTLAFCLNAETGLVGTAVLLKSGRATPQGGGDMSFAFFLVSSFRPGKVLRAISPKLSSLLLQSMRGKSGLLRRYADSLDHSAIINLYTSPGVGGASFFIDRIKYLSMGGFDERFFLYDEDGDLCLRCLKSGFVNHIEPNIKVTTYESATTSKVPSLQLKRIKLKSRLRLIDKHFYGIRRCVLIIITRFTWRLL